MAADFRSVFYQLEYLGLSDVILPFILIFVVVWAIVRKIEMFKDKKISVVIALAIALVTIIPHSLGRYPAGTDVVEIMNTAIPQVGGVIVAVLMLFILVGMWNAEAEWAGYLRGIVVILAMLTVFWIFGRAAGWFINTPRWLFWIENPVNQSLIVILLIGGLIIWAITSESTATPGASVLEEFGKLFKKR
jgi:hypothetical protein